MGGLHRAGGKFTRSHTTLIEAAAPIVDAAQELPEVSKISLGEIKVIGRGLRNVKFFDINGGLRLVVRANTTRQDLYVYTSDPAGTKAVLERAFAGGQ